jgi:hypothetical protein
MTLSATWPASGANAMTIDRTITGYEGRIDLGKLRICFSLNRPRYVLLPLIAIWRI